MARSLLAVLARRVDPSGDRLADAVAPPGSVRLSRREMLVRSLELGAGALLSVAASGSLVAGCAAGSSGARRRAQGPRVIVVGAGLAGLAAAYELVSAGCAVTVLEARRRLGGRVLSFRDLVPGKVVEGGGEYIGANHPTWLAYAKRFGLDLREVGELENVSYPVVIGGRELSEDEVQRIFFQWTLAVTSMTRDAQSVDADRPWTHARARALDEQTMAQWLEAQALDPLTREAARIGFESTNGAAMARQSYLASLATVKGGGLERYWTDTEVFRCAPGNQKLAEALAQGIGPERISLGEPVERVEASERGVRVRAASGRVVEGDELVLAVPPSVWGRMRIEADLPTELTPQMGVVVKHLVPVRSRFWLKEGRSPEAVTDGPIANTWEATDNQPGEEGAALAVFAGGPSGEATRALHASGGSAALDAALERVYPGLGAAREGAAASRFMDWPGDALAGAGYSFPAPGEVTTLGPLLAQPYGPRGPAGRLHLAGEHCSSAFVGYMEGALASGVGVARRIAARHMLARVTR